MKIKTGDKMLGKEEVMFLEETFPFKIKKQVLVLYELGLEPYEINYLIYLKTKERARHKWGD